MRSQRSLRGLTTGIATTIGLCGFALIALIAYMGWQSNVHEVSAERRRLDNAFTERVERTLEQQKTIAWWDDAVEKVANHFDVKFVDENFGFYFTETFGHDEVYILNDKDQPVYAFRGGSRVDPSAFGARAAEFRGVVAATRGQPEALRVDRAADFAEKQGRYKVLKAALTSARWGAKITLVNGKPAIVAAITIVPVLDQTLLKTRPYVLATMVMIDDDLVEEVGKSLLIPDLRLGDPAERRQSSVSQPFVTDDGQDAGRLSWTTSQPGRPFLTIILPLVLVGVMAMWVLSAKMLRRLTDALRELADKEALARHEATHDALSGLPNRPKFIAETTRVIRGANSAPGQGFVVGYLDIDRFKDINDTLGHGMGDELIRQVGHRLEECLGSAYLVSRFGGDEFALLRYPSDVADQQDMAQGVIGLFAEPMMVHGTALRITVSLGLVSFPEQGSSADELLRHADIALYDAKRNGRDRAAYFTATMAEEVKENREIEVDLRAALEQGGLDLYYQPIIASDLRRVTGAEALVRWFHPTKGAISPARFIPVAEETGLMLQLGEWVLRRAIAQAALWPDLGIAINVSPVQFRHANLVAILREALDETGVEAHRLTLEVTEGLLLERSQRTAETLASLRALGFKIALDDFGTGFSSLRYLLDFRFDTLKIDRSFVSGQSQAGSAQTIIRSVVQMARTMGMKVVAEGVETGLEATVMQALGCDYLQGYYFAKPLPALEIAGFAERFQTPEPQTLDKPVPKTKMV